jgi:predicted acylesterase/phospholipase RssA
MQHLLRWRWSGALFGASAYSGKPLAELVDVYISDTLIRAVALESAKGRLLVVATTDLDRQRTVIWDLGLIARQGGEPARRLFRDVLIAAASIPGALPPVMIRVEQAGQVFEEMHADGATTTSLFIAPEVASFLTHEVDGLQGTNLYVIVNGQLGAAARTTPLQTLSIAKRGIEAATLSNVRAEIAIADAFARRNGMVMRMTQIPDDYPFRGPLDLERHRMQALFDFGERCSFQDQLWSTPLEAMEPPERPTDPAGPTVACPAPVGAPAMQSVHALEGRRGTPMQP